MTAVRQVVADVATAPLWLLIITVVTAAAVLVAAVAAVQASLDEPGFAVGFASPVVAAWVLRAGARRLTRKDAAA